MDGEKSAARELAPAWAAPLAHVSSGAQLVATAIPTLSPGMLRGRRRRSAAPFPLDDPGLRTFFFARNGIYALARLWSLSGKEVLFPSYFHGVELEALLAAGVVPRFYPVHGRMEVNPAEVIERIGPETRAVYLIHYAGFPGPVEELAAACRERGILLLEDCALSLLSCLGDRPLGSFGDASIFCFYKTLPTPDGGAVLLRRGGPIGLPEGLPPSPASTLAPMVGSLLQRAEVRGGAPARLVRGAIRAFGKAASRSLALERVATGTQHFDRAHLGLAMSAVTRRIIDAQPFAAIVEKRRRNFFHLLGRLRSQAAPVFGELPPSVCPLFFPLQVRDKRAVMARLHRRGVEAIDFWGVAHPSVSAGAFPESEQLRRTVLEIPCHQDLEPGDVERVADAVVEALREAE